MASVNIAPSQTRLGSVLSDCLLGGVPGKPASLARVGRLSAVVVAAWGGRARLVLSLETVTSLADSAWARPGPAGVPTALLALRCGGRRRLVPPALVACDSERLALSPGARLYVRFFFLFSPLNVLVVLTVDGTFLGFVPQQTDGHILFP